MTKNNQKLSSIVVRKDDLGTLYPMIGSGIEGCVYNYQDSYALKHLSLFRILERYFRIDFSNKFKKLEKLSLLEDESFCFPIGLLEFEDLCFEGYFMKLIKSDKSKKDFNFLSKLKDKDEVSSYLIEADSAIKRAHSLGLILGDIKEENILIGDDGKVYFIDTDNYSYQDFGFDLVPKSAMMLKNIYGRDFDSWDNDKFLFTLMAIKIMTGDSFLSSQLRDTSLLDLAISKLDLDKEVKEGLRLILSDADDKPYFSQVYTLKR